jgi:predicted deacetylase
VPVHVSIHDVSPAWAHEVEAALELCHAEGIRPALLVVPDFHGRAPLLADAPFCARLRDLQAGGHEIYLHGYLHRSRDSYDGAARKDGPTEGGGGLRGRLAWMFAQRVVSGGEAEMSDVSADEGRARIERGEAVLRDAGLRIDGYVAPAWSMPPWLLPRLAARGYRFTEDHAHVYDPLAGRARASVVLNWASRSPGRMLSTVAWCRLAERAPARLPARVAIHPGDMGYLLLRQEIARQLARVRGDVVARGADLL